MRAPGKNVAKIGTVLSTRPPREAAPNDPRTFSKEPPPRLKNKKRTESGRAVGRRRGPLKSNKPLPNKENRTKSPVKKMEVLHHDLLLGAASRLLKAAPVCFKTNCKTNKDFRLPLIK